MAQRGARMRPERLEPLGALGAPLLRLGDAQPHRMRRRAPAPGLGGRAVGQDEGERPVDPPLAKRLLRVEKAQIGRSRLARFG